MGDRGHALKNKQDALETVLILTRAIRKAKEKRRWVSFVPIFLRSRRLDLLIQSGALAVAAVSAPQNLGYRRNN